MQTLTPPGALSRSSSIQLVRTFPLTSGHETDPAEPGSLAVLFQVNAVIA